MDAHFAAVLGTGGAGGAFVPSRTFVGARPGYVFGTGEEGTGYYPDTGRRAQKRGRDDGEAEARGKRGYPGGTGAEAEAGELDGAALLEAAEREAEEDGASTAVVDYDLDLAGLKVLVLGFEKRITKNQKMRVKFADEPVKFVESELELDEEIKKLYALAASPELYPALVDLGAVKSILGLLAHDNTDVSLAVVGLLVELTDPETAEEVSCAVVYTWKGVSCWACEHPTGRQRRGKGVGSRVRTKEYWLGPLSSAPVPPCMRALPQSLPRSP